MPAALMQLAALASNPRMRLDAMHRVFAEQRSPWLSLLFWVVVLGFVLLFLITAARMSRRGPHEPDGRPWPLFIKLLLTVPLTWGQRRALFKLARRAGGPHPAAILMTPTALRQAAAEAAGLSADELPASPAGRPWQAISKTLFNEPLPQPGRGEAPAESVID